MKKAKTKIKKRKKSQKIYKNTDKENLNKELDIILNDNNPDISNESFSSQENKSDEEN